MTGKERLLQSIIRLQGVESNGEALDRLLPEYGQEEREEILRLTCNAALAIYPELREIPHDALLSLVLFAFGIGREFGPLP